MTLKETEEIIEYFNKEVIPNLPENMVEHIAPMPMDAEIQANYMHLFWRDKYRSSPIPDLDRYDLAIAVYYYKKNESLIQSNQLTEKWLNYYGINDFPKTFLEKLGPSLSEVSE